MITCAECGKVLEKVPLWYSIVDIRFVCNACRKVNPQHWLPATLDEPEEEKPLGDEEAFMRGEMESIEELERRDRRRLVGDDDLFDVDFDDESEA